MPSISGRELRSAMIASNPAVSMEAEGVIFRTGFEVGVTVSVQRLLDDYDVLVMAGGAEAPIPREAPLSDAYAPF